MLLFRTGLPSTFLAFWAGLFAIPKELKAYSGIAWNLPPFTSIGQIFKFPSPLGRMDTVPAIPL
jgi:hypothetical protein